MPRRAGGPPTTDKQRYDEYKRSIHLPANACGAQKKAVDALKRTTWYARTVNERTAICNRAIRALNADETVQPLDNAALDANTVVNNLFHTFRFQPQVGEVIQSGLWKRAIEEASTRLRELLPAQIECRRAWTDLRHEHTRQNTVRQNAGNLDVSDPTSIAHAGTKRQDNITAENDSLQRLVQLEGFLERPPVAQDAATGARRIRKTWLPAQRFTN